MTRKEYIKKLRDIKKQADKDYRSAMKELKPGKKRYWINAVFAAGLVGYCSMPTYTPTTTVMTKQRVAEPKKIIVHRQTYEPIPATQISRQPNYHKPVNVARQMEKKDEKNALINGHIYFPIRHDTLIQIARDVTGDMSNWREIQKYNNITDHIIEVNQPIRIPRHLARNHENLYSGTLPRAAIATKNDSLESIAKREMGSMQYADDIFRLNRRLNKRFSKVIYDRQYVFLPPKT